jgi:4-carboxymuconolactone decarboxylase
VIEPSQEESANYKRGLEVRREVLGREYVDSSLAAADDFSEPIQRLVTDYCWGAIWSRPGLDRRSRSILNLGMLTALNRSHELGVHVRAAVNNGVTVEEIQEALMQTAIYVGVPAALESFRIAKRVLDELDAQ